MGLARGLVLQAQVAVGDHGRRAEVVALRVVGEEELVGCIVDEDLGGPDGLGGLGGLGEAPSRHGLEEGGSQERQAFEAAVGQIRGPAGDVGGRRERRRRG